ncbi:hydroxymethylglutaryl-coa synthase [Anaeramoeba flamelloides]|uniref:Hydroxymethylglutaryl-coa synthase n=1 Tax=Anaeramoeba flamelloides TaxID=1746091 RepID=A0AAV7Y3S9_9EUKA|nr:hydroxymethylglutaryl-coa synthase [Anaeramoeba flamelloides]
MKFFEESGNNDVLGVDNINACYGSSAALFNTINWRHSPFYEGRYAIVNITDITNNEKGTTRPTVVVGKLSFGCYLGAIENCYESFQQKFTLCKKKKVDNTEKTETEYQKVNLSMVDFAWFHSTFNEIVVKSCTRMVNTDWLENNQVVVGINEELGMKIKSSSNICYDLLII